MNFEFFFEIKNQNEFFSLQNFIFSQLRIFARVKRTEIPFLRRRRGWGVYYTPTLSNQLHRERGGVVGKDPRREDLGHVKYNFYVFLQNHFPTLSCIWIRVTTIERYQKNCWWRVEEKMSISPTFYGRLFCTKVSRQACLYLHFRFELFLAQEYWRKFAHKMLVKLTTGL